MPIGYADVLIGLQYGDEGKARVVDMIANNYDIVARFNGGANAGHTVEANGTKIALNQIPSAIFYPEKILYIGSGCVVNVEKLMAEIKKVEALNIPLSGRLIVASQASVIQPHHILIDTLTGAEIGTTKNGIGPCYADKAYRMLGNRIVSIRLGELIDNTEEYMKFIRANLEETVKQYGVSLDNIEEQLESFKVALEFITPYVEFNPRFVQEKVEEGAKVLFEGAQSIMLDVTKGSVPFVTSSSTIAAAAYVGGDLPPKYHRKTIGIAKAVMSRVGNGPFPSELGGHQSEKYCGETENGGPKYSKAVESQYNFEQLISSPDDFEVGKALRIISNEYGTVTSRPRRVGVLDLVQLNHAIRTNGVDEVVINKCDILSQYSKTLNKQMPYVTSYTLDDKIIDFIPGSTTVYHRTKPVAQYIPAFSEDISSLKQYDQIPEALKQLIQIIETLANCKVIGIGVGPEREQFIQKL